MVSHFFCRVRVYLPDPYFVFTKGSWISICMLPLICSASRSDSEFPTNAHCFDFPLVMVMTWFLVSFCWTSSCLILVTMLLAALQSWPIVMSASVYFWNLGWGGHCFFLLHQMSSFQSGEYQIVSVLKDLKNPFFFLLPAVWDGRM